MEQLNKEPKRWPRDDLKRAEFRKGLMPSLNKSKHQIIYEPVPEYESDFPECREWLLVKNEEGDTLAMFDEEHGRAVFPQRKENCFFSRIHNDKPILFRIEEIRQWGAIITLRTKNMKRLRMAFHM